MFALVLDESTVEVESVHIKVIFEYTTDSTAYSSFTYANNLINFKEVYINFMWMLLIWQVTYNKPDADWFMKGGLDEPEGDVSMEENDGNTFFFQKWWEMTVCFSDFSFLLKTFLRAHLSNKYAFIFVILKTPAPAPPLKKTLN